MPHPLQSRTVKVWGLDSLARRQSVRLVELIWSSLPQSLIFTVLDLSLGVQFFASSHAGMKVLPLLAFFDDL